MAEAGGEKLRRSAFGERLKKLPIFVLFGVVLFFLMAGFLSKKAVAASAPSVITYQGKLLIGSRLATTTQDIYYLLYDASSGGSILYTASGTILSPAAISTTPSQGLFSINLGDTGTNALSPGIFQNNGSVYLEVRIGADTLTPRKRITASPYAFNSKYLDGVGANTVSSSTYIPVSDVNGNFVFNSTTITTSTISNLIAGFTTTTNLYISGLANFANSTTMQTTTVTGGFYQTGLADCSGQGQTLNYDINAGKFTCLVDDTGGGGGDVNVGTSTANYFAFYTSSTAVTGTSFIQFTNGAFTITTNTVLATTTIGGPLTFSIASGTSITSTNLVVTGALILPANSITDGMVINGLTIDGGTINNTPIGSTAPSTGVFTSLTSSIFFATDTLFVSASTTNLYVSGSLNLPNNSITNAMVADNITASNYLLLTGGTLSGGLIFTTASGTMITSTSAFFGNVTTTNLYVSGIATLATTTVTGNLTFSTASGTSITSTNIIVTNKIGIGTSTPTQALSVVGSVSNIIDANTPVTEIATTTVGSGPYSSFVSGRYAYTANRSADNISIIDISNPVAPVQISTVSVGSNPYSIFVSGRYAYVANRGSATISIIDISNPSAATQIATTSVGSGPQSIFVSGRYAYVANSLDDTISVVDISNPFAPVQIATTSVELTPKSIFVSGRYAYTANSGGSMSVVDISNPSNPIQIATTSVGDPAQSLGPSSIFVSGRYAYTVNANDTFSVVDVANPLAPSEVATTTVGAGTQWLYVSGRYAFTANSSDNNISIVDIARPLAPTQVASSGLIAGSPISIFVSGRYAYTTNLDDTISVIDISGAEVTSLIAHSAEVGNLQSRNDIFAQGNIMAGTSLMVGAGGIYSQGGLSVFSSSTGVTSSIFNVGSSVATGTLRVFADGTIILATTTINGPLTFATATGVSLTSTNLYISSLANFAGTLNFVSASGTSITSTNAFFRNFIATSITSTNLFTTSSVFVNTTISNATSTNLYISNISNFAGLLTFTTASGTSITSTNAFFTNLSATNFSPANISATSITSTNLFVTSSVFVGATSTNLYISNISNFAGLLTFTTASGTSITSTNAFFTNLSATNFSPANISATSITSTNLFATSSVFNTTTINNKLGVGTSTPAKALSVVGSISNVLDTNSDAALVTSTGLTSAAPWGIFVSGKYAYVTHSGSPGILSILDVSVPGTPVQIATTSVGNGSKSVYVSGKYAYVGNESSNNISVVDISNPASPRQVVTSTFVVGGAQGSVFVSGRYLYSENGAGNAFSVTDISIPSAPRHISKVTLANTPNSIYVLGRYAYVTYGSPSNLMLVIDVTDANAMTQAGTVSLNAIPDSVYVSGRYAYTANTTSNTISVIDVSNSASPSVIATTSVGANPVSIFVSGRYAFTANATSNTVSVVDISTPSSPVLIKNIAVGGSPQSVFVSGRYAYVTNNNSSSVSIIDISGTEVTSLIAHSAEVGNLQSKNDIFAQGNIMAGTSLLVGAGGISSQGGLSVFSSSTGATTAIFNVGSKTTTNTLMVFADGTITMGTTTASGLFTFANANGTSITSTNAFFTNLSFTNASGTSITSTNAFFRSLIFTSATGTSITSTNAFFNNLAFTNASGTMITSTNLTVTGSTVLGSTTISNLTSTNHFSTGLTFTNLFGTNATTTNLTATGLTSLNTTTINTRLGIGTSTPTQALSVVGSISNVIDSNTVISQIATTSVGTGPQSIFVFGRYAYVANNSAQSLSVVDVSDPSTPIKISTTTLPGSPNAIFVSGRYAYIGGGIGGAANFFRVFDISDPASPISVGSVNAGVQARSIFVSGHYAYVAGFDNLNNNAFSVLDISNPLNPVTVLSSVNNILPSGAFPASVYVSGRYAYTANSGLNSISVIDISNPSFPIIIASTSVGGSPQSIYVSGRYAYVANATSSNISVVDISSSTNPVQVSTTSVAGNPNSIFVSGRYAYMTNSSSASISIVDVSKPNTPVQVVTTSVGTWPKSIYVSGRYAYVANYLSDSISVVDISGTEVSSLIAHSAEVGNIQSRNDIFAQGNIMAGTSLMVGAGGIMSQGALSVFASSVGATSSIFNVGSTQFSNILQVFADGTISLNTTTINKLLTFTTASGTSITSTNGFFDNLQFTNASGTSITSTNGFLNSLSFTNASGTSITSTNGFLNSLSFTNASGTSITSTNANFSNLTFTNASGTIVTSTNIYVSNKLGINTSSPIASLAVKGVGGTNPFSVNSSTGSSLITILQNGNVGVGTSTPSQRLSVSGNISNIIDSNSGIAQIATTSVGSNPRGIFVSGKYAYVANVSDDTISVLDISNPSAPVQIATASVGDGPGSIYVSGRYAYVLNGNTTTMSVVDISKPKVPRQVSTVVVGQTSKSIFISGQYAYITNAGPDTIAVVNVSNPLSPVLVATTSVGSGSDPEGIYVSGQYAYVANNSSNTISVVDISNPSAPVQIATTSVGVFPTSIYVSGRYAYVANTNSDTISVVDISNPSAPVQIATTSVYGVPWSIFVSGRYVYTANYSSSTISVVDISNPSAPVQIATTSIGTEGSHPLGIYVSGRYAYITNYDSSTISVVDISGTEVASLIVHSAEAGQLQVRNDIFAQGNIMAGTSLMVGAGGIMSQGALSIFASSTGATSSIFSISSVASSSIFNVFANGRVGINVSSPLYNFVSTGTAALPGIGALTGASDFVCYKTTDGQLAHQAGNCTFSSARFKENILSLSQEDLMAKVNALRAVSFNFKPGYIPDHGLNGGGKESTGFIAEEVALIDPTLVVYTDTYSQEDLLFVQNNYPNAVLHKNDQILIPQTVDYARVSVLLTGAIQDINTRLVNYASSTDLLISALNISTINNTITVGSSSNPYDLVITGNIILNQNNLINKLSFATSTLFESSVESFAGARAFTFNAVGFTNPVSDNYILSLRANNNSVFSVAANGDVHALGNYYGASAVLGTSTNPGDLAERVDIAIDDNAEAGDVMMVDRNAPDTYRRSDSAYEQSVAGVISTNPTIVVGNGRTDYTAVLAMVGRVPIKVSDENGAITRGDLLVSASRLGYAMKYDPTRDKNNKVVGIIGMALEPLPASSTGKILALIRTGWVYNRDEDIKKLKNNIEQVATSQGINLDVENNPDNLNIINNNNQLVYSGGNLNLQNNSLINVASIVGKNNKWRIDEFGNLVQKITTAVGDKEIYGLQSSVQREIVISGTSTLENGSKRVTLTDLDQAILDKTVPLKIMVTPSGETKGVYVTERTFDSFLVKENDNGQSNAEFDWTVIAKVLVPEEEILPLPSEPSSTTEVPSSGNGTGQEAITTSSESATSSSPVSTDSPPLPTAEKVLDPIAPAPTETVVDPSPAVVSDPVLAEPPQIVPAVPAP